MAEPRKCVACGEVRTIFGHGLCQRCYSRKRRMDPVQAEKERVVSRAWKDAHRAENQARDRQHDMATKPPCPYCGDPMAHHSTQCDGCRKATAEVRRTLAEGMWAEGWSTREMAATMGVTTSYFPVRRNRDGWDLPHRYPMRDGKRIAA